MVSIIIITIVRDSLYPLVDALLKQSTDFDFEIILIPQGSFDEARLEHKKVKIFPYPKEKGLPYYRNQGVKHSKGDIIAFIDDDEVPKDANWLTNLVSPISEGLAQVTTAGTDIPLKQGFLADSISLLGYPGGAALGFKSVWHVDRFNYTKHICSGNFAIKKSLFEDMNGFNESLKMGTEDVYLSHNLVEAKIPILYVETATINHLPRKKIFEFLRWHFRRGRAVAQFSKLQLFSTNQFLHLFKILWVSISKSALTPYLPMVLILWPIQYSCQAFGMLYNRVKN